MIPSLQAKCGVLQTYNDRSPDRLRGREWVGLAGFRTRAARLSSLLHKPLQFVQGGEPLLLPDAVFLSDISEAIILRAQLHSTAITALLPLVPLVVVRLERVLPRSSSDFPSHLKCSFVLLRLRSVPCRVILSGAPLLLRSPVHQGRSAAIIALQEVWLLLGFNAFRGARGDPVVLDHLDNGAELLA